MRRNLSEVGKAYVFVGLAWGLALAAAIAIRALDVTSDFTMALMYMSTPTLAVLLMLTVVTRDGWSRAGWRMLGLRRSRRRTWPLAATATLLASVLASGAVWVTPLADFDLPPAYVDELINFVINVVLMTLTFALGEELGWRGYLLPRLRRIGRNRSLVVVGLVHAVWHMPLIFLTTLYHSDGNKLVVLPLFTGTLVAASYAFGYLRLGTGSVWPATVAHAAHNAAWSLLGAFTVTSEPVIVEEYLVGDNGLVMLGMTVLAAWWIRGQLVRRSSAPEVHSPVAAAGNTSRHR